MDRSAYLDARSNPSAFAHTLSHGHTVAHSDSYADACADRYSCANSDPGPS